MRLFSWAMLVCLLVMASVVYAEDEPDLIPSNLPVITPENLHQVVEIASIGNGGAGDLYWSPDGQILALNNAYGVWLHHLQALDDEPLFIPAPSLDVLMFSDDSRLLVTWKRRYPDSSPQEWGVALPAQVWDAATGDLVMDWQPGDISDNPNWRYHFDVSISGPMIDRYLVNNLWDIVIGELIYGYISRNNFAEPHISRDNSIALQDRDNPQTFDVATGETIHRFSDQFPPTMTIALLSSAGDLVLGHFFDENIWGLYDASNGEFIRSLDIEQGVQWQFVGFTPDDRYLIARRSEDNRSLVRVWEVATGQIANTFTIASGWPFLVVDYHILQVTSGRFMHLYDLTTGDLITNIEIDEPLSSHTYSPDGCCIAAVTENGVLRIWDIPSAQLIYETDRYQAIGNITAISPDGAHIITVENHANPSTLRVWDVRSGTVRQIHPDGRGNIRPITEFGPNSDFFINSTRGAWEIDDDTVLEWPLYAHLQLINAITYSADGQYLALAGGTLASTEYRVMPPQYFTIAIYNGRYPQQPLAVIVEPAPGNRGFTAVAISPDNRYLVADYRWEVAVWEMEALLEGDQTPFATLSLPRNTSISDLAFSPDGTLIAAGTAELRTRIDGFLPSCNALVWDFADVLARIENGETDIESACLGDMFPSRFVSFNPSGDIVIAYGGGFDWIIPMTLLDPFTGDVLREFSDQTSFVMSPDGTFMISRGYDERLHYWAVATEEEND